MTAIKNRLWEDMDIDDLELSFRSSNRIRAFGTVGRLVRNTEDELLLIKGLGQKSLKEIKQALCLIGLNLGMKSWSIYDPWYEFCF
jgi:DNA-directed RNA polymerase alpha subunit